MYNVRKLEVIMSKILFTDVQVKKLSKNKWIKNITNKGITYTKEFKQKLVKECENYKKFPQEVFRECGINPEIVGKKRIEASAYRWRKQLKSTGDITDTRITNSGNTLKRELSDKEKLKRAEARIKLLEAENELLKKNELIEMGILTDIKSISNLKQ
jgi:transposase-like protein